MNYGEIEYTLSNEDLKKSSFVDLLRLARFLDLRYGLEDMSHRQLRKLIKWRLSRNRRMYG